MLVLEGGQIAGRVLVGSSVERIEQGEAGVAVLEAIEQEAAGQDVGAGNVGLQLEQVAEAPERRLVGIGGQVANKVVVVFEVLGVIEPDFALLERAGNREAGCPLIQVDAANELEGGQEVGAGVAQVLIADAGGEVEHAGGGAPELCGVAAALHVNGADGVGGNAQLQRAINRVGNVEAVHGVERLVSVAAHHVRLARTVLYDAGDIGQDVAVIAGNGIGDVD